MICKPRSLTALSRRFSRHARLRAHPAAQPDRGRHGREGEGCGRPARRVHHWTRSCLPYDRAASKCWAGFALAGLSVRGVGGEHTPIGADGTVDISPRARFCITEAQIITALYLGITQVWRN